MKTGVWADWYNNDQKQSQAIYRNGQKNGKEINRIVEFPIETIEKDILEILTTNDYQNPYDF